MYLTVIIKVNSEATSQGGGHVTAVQASCHFSFLFTQRFCFWGTNQQPATDTQRNHLRHGQLDQMHTVK